MDHLKRYDDLPDDEHRRALELESYYNVIAQGQEIPLDNLLEEKDMPDSRELETKEEEPEEEEEEGGEAVGG